MVQFQNSQTPEQEYLQLLQDPNAQTLLQKWAMYFPDRQLDLESLKWRLGLIQTGQRSLDDQIKDIRTAGQRGVMPDMPTETPPPHTPDAYVPDTPPPAPEEPINPKWTTPDPGGWKPEGTTPESYWQQQSENMTPPAPTDPNEALNKEYNDKIWGLLGQYEGSPYGINDYLIAQAQYKQLFPNDLKMASELALNDVSKKLQGWKQFQDSRPDYDKYRTDTKQYLNDMYNQKMDETKQNIYSSKRNLDQGGVEAAIAKAGSGGALELARLYAELDKYVNEAKGNQANLDRSYGSWLDEFRTGLGQQSYQNTQGQANWLQGLNWQKELTGLQRNWQNEDWDKYQGLANSMAQANKPSWFQYGLAGAGAGAPFGPVGAGVGAGIGALYGLLGGK